MLPNCSKHIFLGSLVLISCVQPLYAQSGGIEIFAGETTLANRALTVGETESFGRVAHCTRFARFGDLDPDPTPAPELGAHSRAILSESGFSPTEIEALFAAGVTTEPVASPAG